MEKEVQALRRGSSRYADQFQGPMLRYRPIPLEASEKRQQIQSRLLRMEDNQKKQEEQMQAMDKRLEHCESRTFSLLTDTDNLFEWTKGQVDFGNGLLEKIEDVEAWTPESNAYITDLAARIEEGEQRTTTLEAWSPEYDPHIMRLEARIEAGELKSGLSSGPVMEDLTNPPTQAATQSRGAAVSASECRSTALRARVMPPDHHNAPPDQGMPQENCLSRVYGGKRDSTSFNSPSTNVGNGR